MINIAIKLIKSAIKCLRNAWWNYLKCPGIFFACFLRGRPSWTRKKPPGYRFQTLSTRSRISGNFTWEHSQVPKKLYILIFVFVCFLLLLVGLLICRRLNVVYGAKCCIYTQDKYMRVSTIDTKSKLLPAL